MDSVSSHAATGPETAVRHRHARIGSFGVFYREAGPTNAPVVLLPHGYPCSSYEFRNLMPALADRYRMLAPDFPGCGYSDTPDSFRYDFEGFADFLEQFLEHLAVERFALYLHDFGSQIGLRLAARRPDRIAGLIIQNGDIYVDALGPKYSTLLDVFKKPDAEARQQILERITEEEFRREFLNEVEPHIAALFPPDLWKLHWTLLSPRRREIAAGVIAGLKENLAWFPRYQKYLRDHQPETLILWGPRDGYMPEKSARVYLQDLPRAELHLFEDGGHWLLETHLAHVLSPLRSFLARLTF